MTVWQWQTWQDTRYLTCSLLQPFPHGFFTRQSQPRSPAELVLALHHTAQVYRVRQVHGNTVLSPSEIQPAAASNLSSSETPVQPAFPPADGLITEQATQAVWVCSADCTPVLIADARTGQVSAVHAGWRGTAAAIVPEAVRRLQAQGSQLSDLRIAMGPAIAGDRYQVAAEVAAQVGATVIKHPVGAATATSAEAGESGAAVEKLLTALQTLPDPPVLHDPKPGHVRLDVRRVNALQLEQMGIAPDQIAIAPYCTYQQPEHFFSYRRDRQKAVQWSGIVSLERAV